MEIEPLRFPLRDGDFVAEILPDLEFHESLVEGLEFDEDGLDFDLDEFLVTPEDGSGISENGFSSAGLDLDSGDPEPSPHPKLVSSGLEWRHSSRSEASLPLAPDRGGSTGVVDFKSDNASPLIESGCSSEGSFTVAVDHRDGGKSQELSGFEGDGRANDCVESALRMEDGSDKTGAKRKQEKGDDLVTNLQAKFLKSDCSADSDSSGVFRQVTEEEEGKKKARLMRNRESAQLSRQRKKHYVEELEEKVRCMSSKIAELNSRIACITAENVSLRQQLGPVYPKPTAHPPPQMTPFSFPWLPCPPYALNAQNGIVFPSGSQVPLVPIPRLRTQQPVSAPKPRKSSSKVNSGKVSKKVASVTFLCFFIFLMYSGGQFSVFSSMYGGNKESFSGRLDYVDSEIESRLKGKVLTGLHHVNGTEDVSVNYLRKLYIDRCMRRGRESSLDPSEFCKECSSLPFSGSDEHGLHGNSSQSLVASLYVPRNDKLVRIDGRLIIQSVLASERSVESLKSRPKNTVSKNAIAESGEGLTSDSGRSPTLPVPVSGKNMEVLPNFYRKQAEHQRALASSSADEYVEDQNTASSFEGPLRQWFREGMAGPILSSGTCTEVFQFEVSSSTANKPRTVVPSTSTGAANSSTHHGDANCSSSGMIKNRRFLYPTAIPLPGKTLLNSTSNHSKNTNQEDTFAGNHSVSSSMVVSVLLDPREAGENGNMMSSPKSLSRILVVVLVDSVKYVTYSCMLPFKNSSHRLH
ncbi:bZIP transcription factor 17 [Nymphaea thermarum]|nr:bZIP transcription factor 17 [Nymphaea thermarum]